MHDQPLKDVRIEQILDHSHNRGQDYGERQAERKRLQGLTPKELKGRLKKLNTT